MVEPEQSTVVALSLAREAAEMLDGIGDKAGAVRLRHAIAVIANDARLASHDGLERPLALMKEALALLDRDGHRLSDAAMTLQSAIDCARTDQPPRNGEEIDEAMFAPRDPERSLSNKE